MTVTVTVDELGLITLGLIEDVAARDCLDEPRTFGDDRQCPDLFPGQYPEGWCEPCRARRLLADLEAVGS